MGTDSENSVSPASLFFAVGALILLILFLITAGNGVDSGVSPIYVIMVFAPFLVVFTLIYLLVNALSTSKNTKDEKKEGEMSMKQLFVALGSGIGIVIILGFFGTI